jgi:hypothetical protein
MMTVVPAGPESMLTWSIIARISAMPFPRKGDGSGPGGSQRPLSVTASHSRPAVTEARSRISPGRSRELASGRVEDTAEHGGAVGAGNGVGEPVHGGQRLTWASALLQQCPASAAQLSHHSGGPEAVPSAVAGHDRDPPVGQHGDVVPVTANV